MAERADESHLDIEQPDQLETYLKSTGRVSAANHITVQHLAGGVSNRTMLVTYGSGPRWVVKQGLAKLRVAVDWFADPVRVHREALAMRWLNQMLPAGSVPTLVFEDPEHHLLAMECVPEPHDNWKTLLLMQRADSDYVRQFGELLGHIHRQGYVECARLPAELSDKSLFEALRLEPYYSYTAEQVPAASSFLRARRAHSIEA